jgi:hypothetical protein
VEALQEQFSRESPVYAKPKTIMHAGQRPVSLGHAAKPPPPLPFATSTTPMPRAGTVAHVIDQRPSLPPKPGSIAHGNFLITSPGHPHASCPHLGSTNQFPNSSYLSKRSSISLRHQLIRLLRVQSSPSHLRNNLMPRRLQVPHLPRSGRQRYMINLSH